jgi:hypothetical protein
LLFEVAHLFACRRFQDRLERLNQIDTCRRDTVSWSNQTPPGYVIGLGQRKVPAWCMHCSSLPVEDSYETTFA